MIIIDEISISIDDVKTKVTMKHVTTNETMSQTTDVLKLIVLGCHKKGL